MVVKSVYIHIPFCQNICTYCSFTKFYYNEKRVDDYLNALENEINKCYKGEEISTLYIGGGTPSCLTIKQLKRLLNILSIFKMNKEYEFTFECNVENIDEEKAAFLYDCGVNRISIGVQSMNPKFLNFLGRGHTKNDVLKKIKTLKEIGFNNINVDLMYALKDQTLKDLKIDVEEFLKIDIDHISTYSLMIEPHTMLHIKKIENIDEDLDSELYDYIRSTLSKNGFIHYEISNFSKPNKESKHNLTYWNNEEYYGFGLGASGYKNNIRYTNTVNFKDYIKGIYKDEAHILSKQEQIENEWILGLRKIEGINIEEFKRKYSLNPINEAVNKMIEEGRLISENNQIYINPKYLYISNRVLINLIGSKYE